MSPQAADARTILITFTIRSFLRRHRELISTRRRPLYLVAEILDAENVDHARTAGADEVIETRMIGYSMIAQAVRHHGTASMMTGVLVSGAHSLFIGQVPRDSDEPVVYGELLAEMKLTKKGGLVIGVRTPAGDDVINPAKSYLLEPGSGLIYLAPEAVLEPFEQAPRSGGGLEVSV